MSIGPTFRRVQVSLIHDVTTYSADSISRDAARHDQPHYVVRKYQTRLGQAKHNKSHGSCENQPCSRRGPRKKPQANFTDLSMASTQADMATFDLKSVQSELSQFVTVIFYMVQLNSVLSPFLFIVGGVGSGFERRCYV